MSGTFSRYVLVLLLSLAALHNCATPASAKGEIGLWFRFKVDPKTPLAELLPVPPKAPLGRPNLGDDLAQAPAIFLEDPAAVVVLLPKAEHQTPRSKDVAILKKDLETLRQLLSTWLNEQQIEAVAIELAVAVRAARVKTGLDVGMNASSWRAALAKQHGQ